MIALLLAALSVTSADGGMSAFPSSFEQGALPAAQETRVLGRKVPDTPGSAHVIDSTELQRQGQTDINRVLAGVPGVYVLEEDGFGLRPNIGMRGVNSDRSAKLTLIEDGVLVAPAPYSAPSAYYFPGLMRMDSVEVLKGAAAIRYGPNSLAGAIIFHTLPVPVGSLVRADFSLGNYGSSKAQLTVGFGEKRFGALVDVAYQTSNGFMVADAKEYTGFSRAEALMKLQYRLIDTGASRHTLFFKASGGLQQDSGTYIGLSAADFAQTPYRRYGAARDDIFRSDRLHFQLSHQAEWSRHLSIVTTLARTDFGRVWQRFQSFGPDAPGPFAALVTLDENNRFALALRSQAAPEDPVRLVQTENDNRFVAQSVQTQVSWNHQFDVVRLEIDAGLRFHHDGVERRPMTRSYLLDATLNPSYLTEFRPGLETRQFARAVSSWVQGTLSWSGLTVSPGLRLEAYDIFQSTRSFTQAGAFVPLLGLGVTYAFRGGLSAVGSVSQGMSPLEPGQPRALRPESATNAELGLRYVSRLVRIEVIGFWSAYQNISADCSPANGCLPDDPVSMVTQGLSRTLGLEVFAQSKQRLGYGFTGRLQGAYTFTQARFLSSFSSDNGLWGLVKAQDAVPYIPEHQFNFRLGLAKGGFDLELGMNHIGEMRERPGIGEIPDRLRIPSRFLLSGNMSYALTPQSTVYITATNLANRSDLVGRRPFGARAQPPLLFQAGLRMKFP
jgi:Fe(3+) dicitrate transport protein